MVSVVFGFVCAAVATVDVATGAAVADDDAVSTIVPPSSTKDKGAYVGVLVAFEGACVGGRGQRGRRPSVVIGGAVLDPAAERVPLDCCAVPPRPLHGTHPIPPSSSSRMCPPHYLPLPPPALADSPWWQEIAGAGAAAATTTALLRFRRHSQAAVTATAASTRTLPPPATAATATRCRRHTATDAAKLPLPPRRRQAAAYKLPLPLPPPPSRCCPSVNITTIASSVALPLHPSCCCHRHHRTELAPQHFRHRQATASVTMLPPLLPRCYHRRQAAIATATKLPPLVLISDFESMLSSDGAN
jgi:hypothetical protein